MPWCPNCRTEYEKGYNNCSDCCENLVEDLEPLPELVYEKETFLMSVTGNIEASIVESLLASCNIPVRKSFREAGGYTTIYMGNSTTGIDLYVPESMLYEAKAIIMTSPDKFSLSIPIAEAEADEDRTENEYADKRNLYGKIMLFVFALPMLITALMYFLSILEQI